jgi:FkbM family methyltransferase
MNLSTKTKILIALIISRPIAWIIKRLTGTKIRLIQRNKIFWKIDLDEGIDFSIFLFGFFERTTSKAIKRLVNNNSIVIDIGANIGAHTLPIAKLLGNKGMVFALEPTEYAFSKLKDNILLNEKISKKIQADQIMLVGLDNTGIPNNLYSSWPLNVQKNHNKHSVHQGVLMETNNAVSKTLDDYVSSQNITKLDLIKLDIDGNELEALNGGVNTLIKLKPTLIMELAPSSYQHPSDFRKLVSLLSKTGYSFYSLDEKTKLSNNIDKLISNISTHGSINIVARISE